ncbi:MAG: major capsid protein [Deltaproteobacteria bacterium]|jgi:hypothetical protein|nr:major capsid protein [Deltaproteobacteria bacterium]
MLNPFDALNAGFSLVEMTEAINKLPNRPNRISSLGLFSDFPITSNVALIEIKRNSLTLLPTQPWGTAGVGSGPTDRELKSLVVPHTPWEDTVMAADVIGVRRFGSDNALETIQDKVLEKLQQAKDAFDATDEYRKVKALQGTVLDADGVTELFNSYAFFGGVRKSFDFKLGDSSQNVPENIIKLKRYMEKNLMGESMTGIRVFVGPVFFDKLVKHPSVKEIFLNWNGALERLGGDFRSGFPLGGVIFEEYSGTVPKPDGSGMVQFVPEDGGMAIPLGTRSTFRRFVAPADYNSTVNTLGQPYYAFQKETYDERGIRLFAQSNTLPICCRPTLLAEVKTSN